MSANRDALTATRNNLIAELAAESRNPLPKYTMDGQTFDWPSWRTEMMRQIKELKMMIDAEDDDDITEVETYGIT